MLEAVAVILARRIDTLRITHERCEQGLREQQISKLATEAELRALRAQINPHFLFNALTTIGYLIQTSPDRALATLMRLTGLLRGVLRPAGEFVTLNEEVELIESYLDIERARFEDRLRVTIDVPCDLRSLRIPPLLVQPLVENAIKHGIAPLKSGGEVIVSARLEKAITGDSYPLESLCISVCDTGVGASEIELAHGRKRGVGINNIEQRLKSYFGPRASLVVNSVPGAGTTVKAWLPVSLTEVSTLKSAAKRRHT
jgi:LytS/YehU family sensor histidine kinase